jgi:hypothetical protein
VFTTPLAATNLPTGSVLIARYLGSRHVSRRDLGGGLVKKPEEVMEIPEAYDLTGSLRAAAALAGQDGRVLGSDAR